MPHKEAVNNNLNHWKQKAEELQDIDYEEKKGKDLDNFLRDIRAAIDALEEWQKSADDDDIGWRLEELENLEEEVIEYRSSLKKTRKD